MASPYVGANAFAGPGGGLVALASLLVLQKDLIHWVRSVDLFRPARQEFLCFFAAMVLALTGCPNIRVGQLGRLFPTQLSTRPAVHEFSAPTFLLLHMPLPESRVRRKGPPPASVPSTSWVTEGLFVSAYAQKDGAPGPQRSRTLGPAFLEPVSSSQFWASHQHNPRAHVPSPLPGGTGGTL